MQAFFLRHASIALPNSTGRHAQGRRLTNEVVSEKQSLQCAQWSAFGCAACSAATKTDQNGVVLPIRCKWVGGESGGMCVPSLGETDEVECPGDSKIAWIVASAFFFVAILICYLVCYMRRSRGKACASSQVAPIAKQQEFSILLVKRKGDSLGLRVDDVDGRKLRIALVEGGVVQEWNDANPRQQVDVGDCIVEINRQRGDSRKILKVSKESSQLAVVIERKATEEMEANEQSVPSGLEILPSPRNLPPLPPRPPAPSSAPPSLPRNANACQGHSPPASPRIPADTESGAANPLEWHLHQEGEGAEASWRAGRAPPRRWQRPSSAGSDRRDIGKERRAQRPSSAPSSPAFSKPLPPSSRATQPLRRSYTAPSRPCSAPSGRQFWGNGDGNVFTVDQQFREAHKVGSARPASAPSARAAASEVDGKNTFAKSQPEAATDARSRQGSKRPSSANGVGDGCPHIANVHRQMLDSMDMPLADRKQLLKAFLRRWHPDKNLDAEKALATAVFQHINGSIGWYLAEN